MEQKDIQAIRIRYKHCDDFRRIIKRKLSDIENQIELENDNECMHYNSMLDSCDRAYDKNYIEIRKMDQYYCLRLLEEAQALKDDLSFVAKTILEEIVANS